MKSASDNMKLHTKNKWFESVDTTNKDKDKNKYNIKKQTEINNTMLNKHNTTSKRKRTNSQSVDKDMNPENRKLLKTNALELMNRLEQFSNVWNDCPDVNNGSDSAYFYENDNKVQQHMQVKNDVVDSMYKHLDRDCSQPHINDTKSNHEEYNPTKNTNKQHLITKLSSKSKTEIETKDIHYSLNNEKKSSELADLKRMKAAIEHRKLYVDQQKLIKKALSALDGVKVNKKVVFNDDSDCDRNEPSQTIISQKENNLIGRTQLFEENDDSEIETELKINSQFKGRKGQKLLQLQSKYASDSRFNLDTRFHDSGSEESEHEIPDNEHPDEKDKQLSILASIVNREIKPLSTIKKEPSKQNEHRWMVRFDPTREDHSKYILEPTELNKGADIKENKKKTKPKKDKINEQDKKVDNKTVVSDEKFYSVKEDLKEVLQTEKKEEFSLLKLFGPKETEDKNIKPEESERLKKRKYKTKNPFKYDSSDSEPEEEADTISKKDNQTSSMSQPPTISTWRNTFFLTENDSRLQEALEFLKAPEDQEDNKDFAEKRKLLKVFIKNKFKNNYRKNGLFQKKLGSLKRKPLSKKKLKNS